MKPGTVGWIDLTVEDAAGVRDFYQNVVGWDHSSVSMDSYDDYAMHAPGDAEPVTGICHSRGTNAEMPPAWIVYFIVENLDESIQACIECGGVVVSGPRAMGKDRYCAIKDPAGAVCALYERGE